MFHGSTLIDERLRAQAAVEERVAGRQVLSARLFYTQVWTGSVICTIERLQPLPILEEFVLRAGIFAAPLRPDEADLSALLGVNSRFIASVSNSLRQDYEALDLETFVVTQRGYEILNTREIPKWEDMRVWVSYIPSLDDWFTTSHADYPTVTEDNTEALPIVGRFVKPRIQTENVKRAAEFSGKPLEIPTSRLYLRDTNGELTDSGYLHWAVFVMRDAALDDLLVTVQPYGTETALPREVSRKVQLTIQTRVNEGHIAPSELMGISAEEFNAIVNKDQQETLSPFENISRQERIIAQTIAQSKQQGIQVAAQQELGGTVELLNDADIRPEFLRSLRAAKHRIFVFSPWMNDRAVDQELIQIIREAASQNVITLLGWGISKRVEDEEKPPQQSLIRKLETISLPSGFPAVAIIWVGNSHRKYVVIDDVVHLSGSFNFLSYKGGYDIRGESIYKVTIPEKVAEAAHQLESDFREAIKADIKKDFAWGNDLQLKRYFMALIACRGLNSAVSLRDVAATKSGRSLEPLRVFFELVKQPIFGINDGQRVEVLRHFATKVREYPWKEGQAARPSLEESLRQLIKVIEEPDAKQHFGQFYEQHKQLWNSLNVVL